MILNLFPGEQLAGDAPRGLGKQMTGGGDKVKRRPLDYYPTPPEATRALIAAERPWLRRYRTIWEPCGRGGAIARELAAQQWATHATDLVPDPANDCAGADLFSIKTAPHPAVVTNFPFALARPMICHLWGVLEVEYIAALFKATFLNCGESAVLEREGMGATRRWDVTWRLDFTDQGNPTMDCVWLVWDRVDPVRHWGLLDRAGPVMPVRGLV